MLLKNKIVTFSKLSEWLTSDISKEEINDWVIQARNSNGWFTEDNVRLSLEMAAIHYLAEYPIKKLVEEYKLTDLKEQKSVGIIAAGNIPLVGLADLVHVLLSGHKAMIKLSSSDQVLMLKIIEKLFKLDEDWKNEIKLVHRLNDADAYIATGSNNSSRYFEYYFSSKPHIIRKNRSSVAVLNGEESSMNLRDLGNDIFRYFGLGCRNISKLFVPENYNFEHFYESIEYWNTIKIHHKYNNNYDYNKSVYLVNRVPHLDNGFLILKEDENLISPLSVLFYETYSSSNNLGEKLIANKEKIQCVVGNSSYSFPTIAFGESQEPRLDEFADDVDTIEFLKSL